MDINSLDDDLRQKLVEKLSNGSQQEWQTMVSLDKDERVATAVSDAISSIPAPVRGATGITLFAPDDLPDGDMLLPTGYALAPSGVYQSNIQDINGKIEAEPRLLTSTPFLVIARDPGSGQVCLAYRIAHSWHDTWIKASRLNASTLADCFVFPEQGVKTKELLAYAYSCVRVAPFALADDELTLAAVEILKQFFPYNDNDLASAIYDFPAFRPFEDVRKFAEPLGVSPFKVAKYWRNQGLARRGNSEVKRIKAKGEGDTPRMVVFTNKVLEFLRQLPA